MGTRSATESVFALLRAFHTRKSWTQADLSRNLGVTAATVSKRLHEMQKLGFPLVRDEDHPHVWWSMPKNWAYDGAALEPADARELVRLLLRTPRGRTRDRLLRKLFAFGEQSTIGVQRERVVADDAWSDTEENFLPTVEDAAHKRVALRFKYFTASRGSIQWRHASVACVLPGPPARFVGVCHLEKGPALKMFRVDNVHAAELDPREPYRDAEDLDVDRFVAESLDGYREGPATTCVFTVRDPEARWVERNLIGTARAERGPSGIRVNVNTGGVLRLARFVVGLGAAATCETEALRAAVREIANGAVRATAQDRAR